MYTIAMRVHCTWQPCGACACEERQQGGAPERAEKPGLAVARAHVAPACQSACADVDVDVAWMDGCNEGGLSIQSSQ